jgi:LacI family transcriptional regulator
MPAPRSKRPRRPAVALLIETSNRYTRELLRGIHDYVREGGDWAFHLTEHGRGEMPPRWLSRWHGDGIIARIENPTIAGAVTAVGVPVVDVSAAGLAPQFPTVISDSAEVAHLAADHLRERGFRHFGFCGDRRFAWSARHAANFVRHLRSAGQDCALFASEEEDFGDWEEERRKLEAWIRELPKPVGIMACYDIRGQQVLEACRELGIRVPDDVAVIGQHNDELLCELCDPPLSSVIPNARRAGYLAATLLGRLMRGDRLRPRVIEVPPLGVATRQSTDVVALADQRLAAVVRFMRANACRNITVADVLKAVPMSRTLLERGFKRWLGRTPHDQIQAVRLERARELLVTGSLPIAEVAEHSGFSGPEYFSAVFKREFGVSPGVFRRQSR